MQNTAIGQANYQNILSDIENEISGEEDILIQSRFRKTNRSCKKQASSNRAQRPKFSIRHFISELRSCPEISEVVLGEQQTTTSSTHSYELVVRPEGYLLSIASRFAKHSYLLVTSNREETKQFIKSIWAQYQT